MPLDRPIFVTGTPRSGKSCIARIIAFAPEFHWAKEPIMLWETGLGKRPDDCRAASEATPQLSVMIERMCERLVATAGKSRYVDDLAYHALRLPFLAALLPNAKIVHVVRRAESAIPEMLYGWTLREPLLKTAKRRRRNIRLTVLPRLAYRLVRNHVLTRVQGHRASWGPRVPGQAEYVAKHSAAEIAAFQWMNMNEIAMDDLAALPRSRWLQVPFERMLAHPAETARQIADFVEIGDVDALVGQAVAFVEPNRVFPKTVQPTADQWASIQQMIAPLNQRLEHLYDWSTA